MISKTYRGITHALPMFLLKPWKKIMCKRDIHVFDEVVSFGGGRRHELVCDACGLVVNIESIDDQYTTGK